MSHVLQILQIDRLSLRYSTVARLRIAAPLWLKGFDQEANAMLNAASTLFQFIPLCGATVSDTFIQNFRMFVTILIKM